MVFAFLFFCRIVPVTFGSCRQPFGRFFARRPLAAPLPIVLAGRKVVSIWEYGVQLAYVLGFDFERLVSRVRNGERFDVERPQSVLNHCVSEREI